MKTPKLNSKQQHAFDFLKVDEWITTSHYNKSWRQAQVLDELVLRGLAIKRSNSMSADEYRRATQKEIIDHLQGTQKTSEPVCKKCGAVHCLHER